jgi:hypothetical protein
VKTAQIGAHGGALGVLAGKIQELAADTSQSTGLVADHLHFLTSHAQDLSKNRGPNAADSSKGSSLELYSSDLEHRVSTLTKLNGVIGKQLTAIAGSGRLLHDNLEKTCGSIELNIRVTEIFDRVLGRLEQALEGLSEQSHTPHNRLILEHFKENRSRYTMHSEREVHSAFGLPGDQNAVITSALPEAKPSEGEGLGDNVELF